MIILQYKNIVLLVLYCHRKSSTGLLQINSHHIVQSVEIFTKSNHTRCYWSLWWWVRVTYHAYCPGCDDEHSLVFLSFPSLSNPWGDSASTTPLESPLQVILVSNPLWFYWVHSTWSYSHAISDCILFMVSNSVFYLFQSPYFVVTKLGSFTPLLFYNSLVFLI